MEEIKDIFVLPGLELRDGSTESSTMNEETKTEVCDSEHLESLGTLEEPRGAQKKERPGSKLRRSAWHKTLRSNPGSQKRQQSELQYSKGKRFPT